MRIFIFCFLIFSPFLVLSQATDLFISEYIEGSAWNKAIELYNGTGDKVDLSLYRVEKDVNGNNVFDSGLDLQGFLDNDAVYVIAHSSADSLKIRLLADTLKGSLASFNGNDQVRLLKNQIEIDRIGVAGDVDFAKDVTLIRKSEIKSPLPGEQDPMTNGQWDAYEKDYFQNLGEHIYTGGFGDLKPRITEFSFLPKYPRTGQDIHISITALDDSGQVQATLCFSINGERHSISMAGEQNSYTASIPLSMFTEGDKIEYYARVEDKSGQADSTDRVGLFAGVSTLRNLKKQDNNGVLLFKNYYVRIRGIIEMDSEILTDRTFIQDDDAGIQLDLQNGHFNTRVGQHLEITGKMDQNQGMAEVVPEDSAGIAYLGLTDSVISNQVSLAELLENPELYEGMLLTISNLSAVNDDWPGEGESAKILVSDNDKTIPVYIDHNTDIYLLDIPPGFVFNLTGIFMQDDTQPPFNSEYYLLPRSTADIQIVTSISQDRQQSGREPELYPVSPNPFNQQTRISFYLPAGSSNKRTELVIYNSSGQKVETLVKKVMQPGRYVVNWHRQNLASGVYFAVLKNGAFIRTTKLTFLK